MIDLTLIEQVPGFRYRGINLPVQGSEKDFSIMNIYSSPLKGLEFPYSGIRLQREDKSIIILLLLMAFFKKK